MASRFHFKGLAVGASGQITNPFTEIIEVQAASALPPIGGYGSSQSTDFRYRDLVSFDFAHTKVIGTKVDSHDEGPTFSTLLQATVEGLNVMDMVTADRVVARLVTDYQDDPGAEPSVKLIGTRFENLRIAGIPVRVRLAVDVLDRYHKHTDLREAYLTQAHVRDLFGNADLKARLDEAPPRVTRWFGSHGEHPEMPAVGGISRISLVQSLEPESPGLDCWGHVIYVRGFGTIRLAEVRISQLTRAVTMLQIDLGCPATGDLMFCSVEDGGDPW